MADEKQPKSLVAKLAEACDAVGGVEKKGENKKKDGSLQYKYVKAADVAKAIRHELFKRGVILIADEKEFHESGKVATYSGSELREFILKVEYTLLDSQSDAKIVSTAFGVAMDGGDKAIYKCKTGALKYFLRGLGLIPDEKDDPEADAEIDHKIHEAEKSYDNRSVRPGRIKQFQVNAFFTHCKDGGKTIPQISTYLKEKFNIVQVEEMTEPQFKEAIQWASSNGNPQDLTKTLETSVKAVRGRKEPEIKGVPGVFEKSRLEITDEDVPF